MTGAFDLDPVSRITADAIGEPGNRRFYLQARKDDTVVSLVVEKTQVEALSRHIDALLSRLDETHPVEEAPKTEASDMTLEEPVDELFRVGEMALGYETERDMILLQCDELVRELDPDEEQDVLKPATEGSTVRFWATRAQMRALAEHSAAVAAAGRPRCQLCGHPIDADGHICPALNGHREPDDLA